MSTKKLSPRQKMISMLYLVLTAMLAMNVSKEVLNAFIVVNEGIRNSNNLVISRNDEQYLKFNLLEKEMKEEEYLALNELVRETKKITNESIKFIDRLKSALVVQSGILITENGDTVYKKLDDIDTGTRILTEKNSQNIIQGVELRNMLNKIHEDLLDIIERGNPTEKNTTEYKDYRTLYKSKLTLQPIPPNVLASNGDDVSWENKNFFHVPIIASDVILSKIQNDIYSSEYEVLEYLLSQVNADLPKFDQLSAAVISPKSYLPVGKNFEADIFIAASSSNQESEVFIGTLDKSKFEKDLEGNIQMTHVLDKELLFKGSFDKIKVVNGKAKFETTTSGIGNKAYEGIIRVKKPTGGYDLYPFKFDYEVAPKSGFSVSPTALNVLYIGLDNPLSITVSGSQDKNVTAKISKGKISKNGKFWTARVMEQGTVDIEVFGVIDGEKKKIGMQKFRALRVPDPTSTLDGISYDGSIRKNKINRHTGIVAKLNDFVFEVPFKIKSYDFVLQSQSNGVLSIPNIQGPLFNKKIKDMMKTIKEGDIVYLQNIVGIGPDRKKRKLNPIVLQVNR